MALGHPSAVSERILSSCEKFAAAENWDLWGRFSVAGHQGHSSGPVGDGDGTLTRRCGRAQILCLWSSDPCKRKRLQGCGDGAAGARSQGEIAGCAAGDTAEAELMTGAKIAAAHRRHARGGADRMLPPRDTHGRVGGARGLPGQVHAESHTREREKKRGGGGRHTIHISVSRQRANMAKPL